MRIIIQRVKKASVAVNHVVIGKIGAGMLIFLAIASYDSDDDLEWMVGKVAELRIFEDQDGKMNLSASESGAEFLVVSQFTLLGECSKGRRPSFDKAAEPLKAEDFYNRFVEKLRQKNFKVETGQFRANMQVELINDGPVTFVVDSSAKGQA
ncbi:MAG: D-tyrosyl-tRNA(Tyr) deacylase [Candidatus Omnitrophica bacterium]|nr:D-tyrosyl-tRNA(Tyr) deacylase [Candidatus Omnitrophota bacterium]